MKKSETPCVHGVHVHLRLEEEKKNNLTKRENAERSSREKEANVDVEEGDEKNRR